MALKGNLRDFSTTQLLNLVNLARKTGLLTIQTPAETAQLYFKEGRLIAAQLNTQDGHLASILIKAGRLLPEQAKLVTDRPEVRSDRHLAQLLLNAGYVTKDDIVQSVKSHMLDIVYKLFDWHQGQFEFVQGVLPSDDRIVVPINLENVIIEGSRRLQESERLQDELPDLNSIGLRFTNHAEARMRSVNLSVEEWRVISFVGQNYTVKQIALANNMNDFQIRKIVYGLLQAGLVEIARPEGAKAPTVASAERRPGVDRPPAVKRSVIERLISRMKRV
jgi:hypothetical protein